MAQGSSQILGTLLLYSWQLKCPLLSRYPLHFRHFNFSRSSFLYRSRISRYRSAVQFIIRIFPQLRLTWPSCRHRRHWILSDVHCCFIWPFQLHRWHSRSVQSELWCRPRQYRQRRISRWLQSRAIWPRQPQRQHFTAFFLFSSSSYSSSLSYSLDEETQSSKYRGALLLRGQSCSSSPSTLLYTFGWLSIQTFRVFTGIGYSGMAYNRVFRQFQQIVFLALMPALLQLIARLLSADSMPSRHQATASIVGLLSNLQIPLLFLILYRLKLLNFLSLSSFAATPLPLPLLLQFSSLLFPFSSLTFSFPISTSSTECELSESTMTSIGFLGVQGASECSYFFYYYLQYRFSFIFYFFDFICEPFENISLLCY